MEFQYHISMKIGFYSDKYKKEYFLIPICANYTFIGKGVRSLPHIHPVYHLMFVTHGSGSLENDLGIYSLQERDLFVIHPNEKHILSSASETGMTYFTFNFYLLTEENYKNMDMNQYWLNHEYQRVIHSKAELSRLDDLFDFKISDIYFEFPKDKWGELVSLISTFSGTTEEYFTNIIKKWQNKASWNEKRCQDSFATFFWNLYCILSRLEPEDEKNNDALLHGIIDYLKKNVHKKYSLSDLASHLNYHPVYLCSYFKEKTGITINRYFNKLKILEACKYLKTTDKTITEIAYLLNFSSPTHFSNSFIKEKSISPSEYRKAKSTMNQQIL